MFYEYSSHWFWTNLAFLFLFSAPAVKQEYQYISFWHSNREHRTITNELGNNESY